MCENYGKFGAIRAYEAEVGTIQGSEGIEYEVKSSVKSSDPYYDFIVSITDGNDEGEVWTVDYIVKTKRSNLKNKKGKNRCVVLSAERYTPAKVAVVSCFTKFYFGKNNLDFDFKIDSENTVNVTYASVENSVLEVYEGNQQPNILSDRSSHPNYLKYTLGTDKTDSWMSLEFIIPPDYASKTKIFEAYVLARDGHGASLHQVLCTNHNQNHN